MDTLSRADSPAGSPEAYLDVESAALVQLVKRFRQRDRREKWVRVEFVQSQMYLVRGMSRDGIAATGRWPRPIEVHSLWLDTISNYPPEGSQWRLEVASGRVKLRDFEVMFRYADGSARDDEGMSRSQAISMALIELSKYRVTLEELESLTESADSSHAGLWDVEGLAQITDIARAWASLAQYGVTPDSIRKLLMQKTRDLWRHPPGRRESC